MKMRISLTTMLLVGLLSGGCATKIMITSEPEGAMVRLRGEGRAAFRWKTGSTVTPCEMSVPYGRVSVYVIWPEETMQPGGEIVGVKSEKKQIDMSAWRDTESVHFVKP